MADGGSPGEHSDSCGKKPPATARRWTDAETSAFLSIMRGTEDCMGYHDRIKKKKLERKKAMEEVAGLLQKKGIDVTGAQVDNKWEALLKRYRAVEDHNGRSGNDPMKEDFWHADMAEIMGDRASTRPRLLHGSGLPLPAPLLAEEDSESPSSLSSRGSDDSLLFSGYGESSRRRHRSFVPMAGDAEVSDEEEIAGGPRQFESRSCEERETSRTTLKRRAPRNDGATEKKKSRSRAGV